MPEVRPIVLPGEMIEERKGRKLSSNAYEEDGKVFSKVLGIPKITQNEIGVIPLAGVYFPRVGDKVIGIIREIEISGWLVDINSPYVAFLPLAEAVEEYIDLSRADISRYYDVGDKIFCRISKVTKSKVVQVSMRNTSKKLIGGAIVKITPSKVPRVIGKNGSMINLIKNKTGCKILVGQNGLVWVEGERKAKAIEAILTIERKSHFYGLTEEIEKLLMK